MGPRGNGLRKQGDPRADLEYGMVMRRGGKVASAVILLLSGLVASCAPANRGASEAAPPEASTSAAPIASAEADRQQCPPDTVWEGDQCVLSHPPDPPQPEPTAEPEPTATAVATATMSFQMENGAIKLPGPVLFETGKEKLRPESDAILEIVKGYLVAKPAITLLRIEGHTDSTGLAAANQLLSERRALSCARWLVAHGVSCKRVLPVGFGDSKPIAPNNTADGRAMNRRMSFVNASLKGKPIGGMPVDGGGKVAGDPCSAGP